jgi:dihydroorotase
MEKSDNSSVWMERKFIDPHAHCRDWSQSYKATIASVMKLAKSQGVVAICDMPNANPPITTPELVEKRLKTAEDEGVTSGYYLFAGATRSKEQLKQAFKLAAEHPKVVGIKLYAGVSVGDLAMPEREDQRLVYRTAAETGYEGVIAVHCEEESLGDAGKWDPKRPASWNEAKPPIMETVGLDNQIRYAKEEGFEGHLHVCHITTPEAVRRVDQERKNMGISCGSTPHHLSLCTEEDMQTEESIRYKVNPPIRNRGMMLGLRSLLKEGKIDFIETDHAPHSPEEKTKSPFLSGIPALANYAAFVAGLQKDGFNDEQITKITYTNVKNVYAKIKE